MRLLTTSRLPRLIVPPGVFRPISDTWLLADALQREPLAPGARMLDLCAGSGALAIAAALGGSRDVTAVDVSRRAVATIRLNAALNRVRVRARHGDLFAAVDGERFDVIVANPPYVPATTDELPQRGPARAWEGGRDGRALLDRICAGAPRHLLPGGRLLVVHSSLIGAERTQAALEAAGLEAAVVSGQTGPLGPLMRARRDAGLLDPEVENEDVLVIRGTQLPIRPLPAVGPG